jgi:diacylglycerol kinase family enzyme
MSDVSRTALPDQGRARSYYVLLNPDSGTALAQGITADSLRQKFKEHGYIAEVDGNSGIALEKRIQAATKSGADIVVSAGGDGTATAIAGALVGSAVSLALLPLGTANMLARDLGLPLVLDEAIAGLEALAPRQIDVGEVNGRIYLHQVVVGIIPAIAAAREQIRRRGGLASYLSFASYMVRRLTTGRRLALAIKSSDSKDRVQRVHAVAVANNAFDEGWGKLFHRSRLDAGTLTLYIVRTLTVPEALRLWAEMLTGRWQADEAITIEPVHDVELRSTRAMLSAMIDGEVQMLATPLRFVIRPKALSVLAPLLLDKSAGTQPEGTSVVP